MGKFWETSEAKRFYWTEKAIEPQKQWSSDADAAFYHSTTWRKLRKVYIKNHTICELCKTVNVIKKATVIDHIQPIRLGGAKLAWDNLQALCTSCHNSKSARERT